jgi:hypothetical protein
MISRLPARRDGTGYAFILRDGLTPVIARPPVIWHGSWYKQFTRRGQRRSRPPVPLPLSPLPPAPAGPDDLAWDDTVPLTSAAIAPTPPATAGHAWHGSGDGQPAAGGNDQPHQSQGARAWHGTGEHHDRA